VRILACFVRGQQSPSAYRSLLRYAPIGSLELVDVGNDVSSYWHAIRDRWNGEDDLVTIEQDNIITGEVIPSFQECEKKWCSFSYLGPPGMSFDDSGQGRVLKKSLGCTRFSAELQREIPASMISDSDYFVWHLLDLRISRLLELHNHEPHCHGEIKHAHNYDYDPEHVERDRLKRMASVTPALPPLRGGHQGATE
jgi:hypothetical protein